MERPAARVDRSLANAVRDLATLGPREVAYNFAYLAVTWAIILGGVAWAAASESWLAIALAFVLVSSRQQALLNLEHECIHGLFTRSRVWNERIAVIFCAYPCGSPFFSTRAHHLAHHRLLGAAADPDAALHRGRDKENPRGLAAHFARGLLGGYAARVLLARGESAADPAVKARDRRGLVASQLVLAAGMTATLGWWVYPALWLAPLATLTTVCHLVRSYCEHALAPPEEADHAERLISIRSNPFERGLIAPYFMNFHAEHHLFPWVPSQRLPEVAARLSVDPGYTELRLERPSYVGALRVQLGALRAATR